MRWGVPMRGGLAGLAGAGLLLASAPGCRGPAQVRYEEQLDRTPAPAAHAVHSERLAELMRSLDRLRDERLPQAMEVGVERRRRAEALREVALGMARSAARIPDAAPAALDAPERAEFDALASELEQRAQGVADAAPRDPTAALEERVRALEATCDRCHARFRVPLAPRRGDARPPSP
jgi:cytochrome c5